MSREDRRNYEADVYYEVWRSGGNADRIDYDRVEESFHDGMYSEEAARIELRAQQPPQPEYSQEDAR